MYNLTIITDNTDASNRIRLLIPWTDYGFREIREVSSISQLNHLFCAGFPALVILDAQFTGSETLNIIRQIKKISRGTQIIIITSENDFELAQAAINLQIAALLLWNELNSGMLIEILERIIKHLDDYFHHQGIIKRQLFRDILKGKIPTPEEIGRYFEIHAPNSHYIMFLIRRDLPSPVINTPVPSMEDYYAVNWHGSNFPEELSYIATVNISMHAWCSLLRIRDVCSSARIHTVSRAAATALQASFKQQFRDTVSIACSPSFSNFQKTLSTVEILEECLEMQKYYGRERLCSYADYSPCLDSCEELLRNTGEAFSSCIFHEDSAGSLALVKGLLQRLAREHYRYPCVFKACRLFTAILNGYCVRKRIATLEERYVHHNLPDPFCFGVREMTRWFQNVISLLIRESGASPLTHYSRKVQDIIEYLEQNYNKDTDVNTLAGHFHISSDYLRHLFKNETGENLSCYITGIKIEKAKLLLSTGHYKIYEIARMTGFHTSQYFGTVFRKQVGITPREFLHQSKANSLSED